MHPKKNQSRKSILLNSFFSSPRRVFAAIAIICAAMLAFGIFYLQNVVGLEPCPMCIVQRYALIIVGVFSAFAAFSRKPGAWRFWGLLSVAMSAFGAFTAARQSWLQWNPPEFATCGRDIYGMIESFPLQRAIPMIFKGSGDCSAVDWTFLGGTIANWSFVWFVIFAIVILAVLLRLPRRVNGGMPA
ncbi:MAG: disulfide bond formation protein B [Ottowia sp.]